VFAWRTCRGSRTLAGGGREAWFVGTGCAVTEFQAALAACLSLNRTFDAYLAGDAAILIQPNTTRFSNDLDYFHDSEQRVAEAYRADLALLEEHGYTSRLDVSLPGYMRAVVRRGDVTKVSGPMTQLAVSPDDPLRTLQVRRIRSISR
jgi:hypothetical protein